MDGIALFAVRRLCAVVLVSVVVSALAWITLHALVPETFPDDGPLPAELARYLVRAFVHLDLGESVVRPFGRVTDLVARGLPADAYLVLGGLAAGLGLGVLGGVVCATRPRSLADRALQAVAMVLLCSPVFFLGMAVILLFTPGIGAPFPLGIVAPNDYRAPSEDLLHWLRAMVVPWLICGAPLAGAALRTTQVQLREVLAADYIRTAQAKGLKPARVVGRHALPVALAPVLGLTAAWVPLTVGNAILLERVFGIPGMYQLVPDAIDKGNYDLVLGMLVVTSVLVVAVGGVVDVVHGVLDPRVRLRD